MDFILNNEMGIRLSFFFGSFAVMALWEVFAPCRALKISRWLRWSNNFGLVFFNSFVVRLLFPMAAVGVAVFATEQGWGLFNYYDVSPMIAIFAAIIIMDFTIYLQHIMVHAVPVLWRLHRVHHADLDFDVTTGARFHTLEIIFSMLIKFAVILLLGAPVVAVIIFEVVLNAMSMFNHANVRLPKSIEPLVRSLFVTPDMHRVHHSVEDDETNSNFGFNLSIWDRLMGTYRDQPRAGHEAMEIGIHNFHDKKQVVWLSGLLSLPFVGKVNDYVINRRNWNDAKSTEKADE